MFGNIASEIEDFSIICDNGFRSERELFLVF